MKKQYCLEWMNKSGRSGCKNIGYDCPKQAEKELRKKIKQESCASAWVNWNWVGNDVSDDELGNDYYFKGIHKNYVELFGRKVWIENDYIED